MSSNLEAKETLKQALENVLMSNANQDLNASMEDASNLMINAQLSVVPQDTDVSKETVCPENIKPERQSAPPLASL